MSQLVPYHLTSSEQDDSLMFATMFEYQNDDYNYNKPVVSIYTIDFLSLLGSSYRVGLPRLDFV